jgi:hypothetical protein
MLCSIFHESVFHSWSVRIITEGSFLLWLSWHHSSHGISWRTQAFYAIKPLCSVWQWKEFRIDKTSAEICPCNVTSRMCLEMKMLAGWQQISYGESGNNLVKFYHIRLNSVNRTVVMVSLENISVLYLGTGSSAKLSIQRLNTKWNMSHM